MLIHPAHTAPGFLPGIKWRARLVCDADGQKCPNATNKKEAMAAAPTKGQRLGAIGTMHTGLLA
jgi:hypothetical protein